MYNGSFQKRSTPPPTRTKWKMTPPLPFPSDIRERFNPLPLRTVKPKLYPPSSDIRYFQRFNENMFSNAFTTSVQLETLKKADDMLTEAKEMATALKDVPKSCLTGSSVCENTLVKKIRRLQNAREKINRNICSKDSRWLKVARGSNSVWRTCFAY